MDNEGKTSVLLLLFLTYTNLLWVHWWPFKAFMAPAPKLGL